MIRGPKSKINFGWNKNLTTPSPILPPIFKKFELWPIGNSKWYNSVRVQDNCALCLPTPYFQGQAI